MDRRAVRSHQRIETDGYICSRVVCGLQHEIEADSLIPSTKQRNFGAVPSAIDDLPGEILFVESCPELVLGHFVAAFVRPYCGDVPGMHGGWHEQRKPGCDSEAVLVG